MTDVNDEVATRQPFSVRVEKELDGNKNWPHPGDLLDRYVEIQNLSPMLLNAETPLVFSIDATWGGGKTTFIKLWQSYLKHGKNNSNSYKSLYFNAWESDFCEDPLLPLLSALETQWIGKEGKRFKKAAWKKAKGLALKMIKPAITAVAKHYTFDLLNADKEYEKVTADFAADGAGKLLDEFTSQQASLEKFKESLQEVLTGLPAYQQNLIIFVDELDRCKPTYAIEVLERIKHLFNVGRVIFVLAVNRAELSNAIQGVYGSNFDGSAYLKRFIDLEYTLQIPTRKKYITLKMRGSGIEDSFQQKLQKPIDHVTDTIRFLSDRFKYSLRDIDQLLTRLKLILTAMDYFDKNDADLIIVLLFLRENKREMYELFVENKVNPNLVIEYLFDSSIEVMQLSQATTVIACTLLCVGSRPSKAFRL